MDDSLFLHFIHRMVTRKTTAESSKVGFSGQGMGWLGFQEVGEPIFLNSAKSGVGFFRFLRKLKKDPENPVNPV
jgi:hypothetical protein